MGNHRADRRGPSRGAVDDPGRTAPAAVGRVRRPTPIRRAGSRLRGRPSAPILPGVAAAPPSSAPVALLAAAGSAVALGQATLADGSHASALTRGVRGARRHRRVRLRRRRPRRRRQPRLRPRSALANAADAELAGRGRGAGPGSATPRSPARRTAEKQADQIAQEPLGAAGPVGYHLTARFGDSSGLWAHRHTGLDFAAPTGTPILAVASGVDHRGRLRRRLRQPTVEHARRRHRALVLPPDDVRLTVGEQVTPGQVDRLRRLDRQRHRPAPAPRGPPRRRRPGRPVPRRCCARLQPDAPAQLAAYPRRHSFSTGA